VFFYRQSLPAARTVKPRRVILLVESSRAYGRGCLLGVAGYVRAHGNWKVLHLERRMAEGVPAVLKRWKGDGVLARVENRRTAQTLARLRLPTVDLRGRFCPPGGAVLVTDPCECARLAVEHFLDRGFRHFAYCGFPRIDFSDERDTCFRTHLATRGFQVDSYVPPRGQRSEDTTAREARGELDERRIAEWLLTLPQPLAVFACNDARGRQVLAACQLAGLAVPEQVAVLGVDNDEVICELSDPPLSSVEPDARRIGYEGAALLERLMEGDAPAEKTISIPPLGIVSRRSSDAVAVNDPEVAAALHHIRDHACEGLRVPDVVSILSISRATLERRFMQVLGRTPAAEMERVRMHHARLLLSETNYKLRRIAALVGYTSDAQFVTAFRRRMGCTPGQFRARRA
jgi:LacI family transcriptional regulator